MKLLLVRHAESMGNATGEYGTDTSDSLSPAGLCQAENLVEPLGAYRIHTIIVSPLKRTMQTITPYLTKTRQPGELWPEITEACWHDEREDVADNWRSQPARLVDGQAMMFRFRDGVAIRPAHPETFGEGLRRVYDALERLEEMAKESNEFVLMVTHGHMIRELINRMFGTQEILPYPHDNCGMTLLEYKDAWLMHCCNRPGVG
jgi:broad specificity phosphatase PhoE